MLGGLGVLSRFDKLGSVAKLGNAYDLYELTRVISYSD